MYISFNVNYFEVPLDGEKIETVCREFLKACQLHTVKLNSCSCVGFVKLPDETLDGIKLTESCDVSCFVF